MSTRCDGHTAREATNFLRSSSGIQILPAILPTVAKVTTFVREPTWVATGGGFAGFLPRKFSEAERAEFAQNEDKLLAYRRWIDHNQNKAFPLFIDNTEAQSLTREYFVASMKERLKDQYLEEKLIPEWAVGCRRYAKFR